MWHDENIHEIYDWASFTVNTATTNYDVKANIAALFNNIPRAKGCVIQTDQAISIRFNNTAYPAIALATARQPGEWINKISINNIYITNASGSTATIAIMLFL